MEDFDFFLDQLYPLPLVRKKLFGTTAYYLDAKIVFAFSTSDKWPEDIGIWIAAPLEHQPLLLEKLKTYRDIQRINTKKWILLPADSDTFEEDARTVADLIKKGSEWIGTVPKPKRKK